MAPRNPVVAEGGTDAPYDRAQAPEEDGQPPDPRGGGGAPRGSARGAQGHRTHLVARRLTR
ncbi:hypothetical protein SGPA1_20072 [Streptomyces misionensis JCM 4497]